MSSNRWDLPIGRITRSGPEAAEDYLPPNPPATEDQLGEFEEREGILLGGSYREFLCMMNGWRISLRRILFPLEDVTLGSDSIGSLHEQLSFLEPGELPFGAKGIDEFLPIGYGFDVAYDIGIHIGASASDDPGVIVARPYTEQGWFLYPTFYDYVANGLAPDMEYSTKWGIST